MTKMTGPLGDISYYDENLYKPKESAISQPIAGFGRKAQTQSVAFASQKPEPFSPPIPERKPRYAELGFDGKDLSWIENEEVKKSWPAMSGQPNYQSRFAFDLTDEEMPWNSEEGGGFIRVEQIMLLVFFHT